MLCGHTHGGQICLPGGVPVLTDADSPRSLARGPWRYRAMAGYTSAGAGSCIVDVRLELPAGNHPAPAAARCRAIGSVRPIADMQPEQQR